MDGPRYDGGCYFGCDTGERAVRYFRGMSRTYFHSPSGTAHLYGRARALAGGHVDRHAVAEALTIGAARLRTVLPPESYPLNYTGPEFAERFSMWAANLTGNHISVPGLNGHQPINLWELNLNTALCDGGDVFKLMARLHGQCEIHAYVEGPNRVWLAGIMRQGLAAKLFRPDDNWESVAAFLEERSDEPVVMSYSVTDGFPNAAHYDGDAPADQEDDDWFYELPEEEQWTSCMALLRREKPWLELDPETWNNYRFTHNLTWHDIISALTPCATPATL